MLNSLDKKLNLLIRESFDSGRLFLGMAQKSKNDELRRFYILHAILKFAEAETKEQGLRKTVALENSASCLKWLGGDQNSKDALRRALLVPIIDNRNVAVKQYSWRAKSDELGQVLNWVFKRRCSGLMLVTRRTPDCPNSRDQAAVHQALRPRGHGL